MSLLARTKEIFGAPKEIEDVLNINTAALCEGEEYLYDYGKLSEEKAQALRNATNEIRRRSLKSALEAAAIGKKLLEVKEYLPHGEYLNWIEEEFAKPGYFGRWAARNYVNAYLFLEKYKDLKGLVNNLSPNTVYIAARCDENVQQEIIEAAKYYKLNKTEVQKIINLHKTDEADYEDILHDLEEIEGSSVKQVSLPISMVDVTAVECPNEITFKVGDDIELTLSEIKDETEAEETEVTVQQKSKEKEGLDKLSEATKFVIYQTPLVQEEVAPNTELIKELYSKLGEAKSILVARADTLPSYIVALTSAGFSIHCISSIRRDIRTIVSNDEVSYSSFVLFCVIFSKKGEYIDNIHDFVNNPKIGILHFTYALCDLNDEIAFVSEQAESESCLSPTQIETLRERNKLIVI